MGAGCGCLEAGADVVVQVQLDIRIGHLAACANSPARVSQERLAKLRKKAHP